MPSTDDKKTPKPRKLNKLERAVLGGPRLRVMRRNSSLYGGGKNVTPNLLLIEMHYKSIGLDKGWGRNRFFRLCRMLKMTEWEVAKMFLIDNATLARSIKSDKFKPTISLHFAIIERWYLAQRGLVANVPVLPLHKILSNQNNTEATHHD